MAQLTFVDWQQPIGCGGVAIFPDDILIADQDGAVVIPNAMAQDILESSQETEALEEWILGQVNAGRKLPGLYPPNEDAKAAVSILEIPALAAKRVSVKRPGRTNEPTRAFSGLTESRGFRLACDHDSLRQSNRRWGASWAWLTRRTFGSG